MLDARVAWARGQVVLKFLDRFQRPFYERFDPPVVQISYIAPYLVAGSRALGKEPKTHTLHFTAYQEFPCDDHLLSSPLA
jgi:hypothetical protein